MTHVILASPFLLVLAAKAWTWGFHHLHLIFYHQHNRSRSTWMKIHNIFEFMLYIDDFEEPMIDWTLWCFVILLYWNKQHRVNAGKERGETFCPLLEIGWDPTTLKTNHCSASALHFWLHSTNEFILCLVLVFWLWNGWSFSRSSFIETWICNVCLLNDLQTCDLHPYGSGYLEWSGRFSWGNFDFDSQCLCKLLDETNCLLFFILILHHLVTTHGHDPDWPLLTNSFITACFTS